MSPRATWTPYKKTRAIRSFYLNQEKEWGRVTSSYWDGPTLDYVSYTKSIPTWYQQSITLEKEEAGLFLDLDEGILWFCKNGLRQFSIADELRGQYIFVVSINQARNRRDGEPPISFECRTCCANSTADDRSTINTRAEREINETSNENKVKMIKGGSSDDSTVHNNTEDELD